MSKSEQAPDVTGIAVEFEDGNVKQIVKGCCVDLESVEDKIHIAMLNVQPYDLVRLAYGLTMVVKEMGMMDQLMMFAGGKEKADEQGI